MAINVAIIPARGGSKRLPNKNILPLAGKPLIAWTIEAAFQSEQFDLVLVSTDSEEIAEVAKSYGAMVPFIRPVELATDTATTNDVISHMVEKVEVAFGVISKVTLLQPTSPLRDAIDIKEAMMLYERKHAMAIISVCEMEHPIQYCNVLPNNLSMENFIPTLMNRRSQDLVPYYRVNGAIYIFDRKFVGKLSEIYGGNSFAYVMSKEKSIDIDDKFDFEIANAILTYNISV